MEKTKRKKRLSEYSFLRLSPGYLLLVIWVAFTIILIGWIIGASFATTREIFTGTMFKSGLHFDNYVRALIDNRLMLYFANTIIYTFTALIGILVISAPASYVLSRFKFTGNKLIKNLFVSAMGIPQIMIILPLFYIASLVKITNTRWVLILLYIGTGIPFTTFFLLSFFSTLPTTFEEAAAIDGCGPIKTFWVIMMPLAQPGIITIMIFDFIIYWNEYFMALVFATKSALRPVAVGLFSMIQSMRYIGDWAGMFAAVVLVFMPTVILYVLLSEKIIQGVTAGAIKG